jgi:hypothetical protein
MQDTIMKIRKPKFFAAVLLLVLTISCLSITIPAIKADDKYNRTTYLLAAAEPSPIGVGQTIYLTYLIENVPPAVLPTSTPKFFYWSGITLTITLPDGTTKTVTGLSTSYAGAGTYAYVPSQVGNYSFVASFAGQTIPSGPNIGMVFKPSTSQSITFEVTDEQLTMISYPLPTEYWTFPIEAQNQQWYQYAGSWLAGRFPSPSVQNAWNPYTQGPYSAHVMWSKQWTIGGLVGGSNLAELYQFGRWPGGSDQYFSPYIINGIMYTNLPQYYPVGGTTGAGGGAQPAGFEAIELSTGNVLWKQTLYNDSLTCAQILSYQKSTMAQGTYTTLWNTAGTTWRTYDPLTGNLIQTITNAASGGKITFGPNGELMIYYINANGWLSLWNSTYFECAVAQMTGWGNGWIYDPNVVYVVPQGTYNFSLGYQWNVTIPKITGIGFTPGTLPNDMLIVQRSIAATNTSTTMLEQMAISIKPDQYTMAPYNTIGSGALQTTTGNQSAQILWGPRNITTFIDNDGYERIETAGYMDDGTPIFVIYPRQTLQIDVYNALTGNKICSTEPFANMFATFDGESNNIQIADGKIYACGYDGTMNCFDPATGHLEWTYYVGDAGLNTPYGSWPIEGTYSYYTIAGDVIYMGANEHSPANPTWLGGQIWAVNKTDGTLLWKIDSIQDETQPIAAYGNQIIYLNFYDGKLYDIGKGPSKTTVSAPQTQIIAGNTITITGSVLDKSPGATQTEQAARFPNGMPCISDVSMNDWMNYVYMQKPAPTDATGVQVTISAIDPNHNYITLGTTTSDTNGNYGFTWNTPEVPGAYQIIATFSGTNSYWGSSDTSYMSIVQGATVAPTTNTTPTQSIADQYFIPAIAALFIVMILGFALLYFAPRKHQ